MTVVLVPILQGLVLLCEALSTIILINSLLSMFARGSKLQDLTSTFCEPFLAPFRTLLDKFNNSYMRLDFSPVLAMLALYAVSALLSACIARL